MKIHSTILKSFVLSLAVYNLAQSQQLGGDEVIVACLKANPVMVYVDADKALSDKLVNEAKAAFKRGTLLCDDKKPENWFCEENEYRVFQGLNGNGEKQDYAFICGATEEKFKFYSWEYLTHQACLEASWSDNEYNFNSVTDE